MIEVKDLVKEFGTFRAVNKVSFKVEPGEVLGFLGPNGAGKSTTMRIITGFLPPTEGTVLVGGLDVQKDPVGVRQQIGYLPESAPSYEEMSVTEFLRFIAEARGFKGAERDKNVDRAMDITALNDVKNQIIETLSKGYRQRVCFSQALVHNPPVLILDEPTDGLDPNQKHEMREVIRGMAEEKTIILSTHILEEMEAVCTRAIIIAKGELLVDGTPAELSAMSRFYNAVTLKTTETKDISSALEKIKGVASVERSSAGNQTRYQVFPEKGGVILPDVTRYLEGEKIHIEEVFSEPGRIDEVFRRVTTE